jgi:hypothetical protein
VKAEIEGRTFTVFTDFELDLLFIRGILSPKEWVKGWIISLRPLRKAQAMIRPGLS